MARLTWHEPKRQWTLEHRGIDFADFADVFEREHAITQDTRRDYGETRYVVTGFLNNQLIVAAFVMRGGWYRVISMRKANEREKASFDTKLGQNPQE